MSAASTNSVHIPKSTLDIKELVEKAQVGTEQYLRDALSNDLVDLQLFEDAIDRTVPNLEQWLCSDDIDRVSPNAKRGIAAAILDQRWEAVVNAFRRDLSFGTGGIRGMMAFDRSSIECLKEDGIDAPILKGPNTLNNIVLLRVSAGVARFGQSKGLSKIVIGYDSRIRGGDFGRIIAELFLAYDFTVYFFDEPCPYPEVTFAIPYDEIKSDLGILISASHNDYRYNGYKLSCANGSQFDPQQRDEMYEQYIRKATFEDIRLCPLAQARKSKLVFLGGSEKLPGVDYFDRDLLNIHDRHRDHILGQLVDPNRVREQNCSTAAIKLRLGYCAFHGVGRNAVPRLLHQVGIDVFNPITVNRLNDLNGLFPSFCSEPGREQQPDPGDPRAAKVAVEAFEKEYPGELANTDIIIGTDPDADRCGVIVKVPERQCHLYGGDAFALLPADDMWALIVWYRLRSEICKHGKVVDPETKFIVQSVSTTNSIVRMARKFGLGVVMTWVGFANLAAGTRMVWDREEIPPLSEGKRSATDDLCHPFIWEVAGMDNGQRSFNYAAMEQSNGFSILGGPPPDERSLGTDGHVRDKDGTFAAILIAEIASYAKANGTTLFEMVDRHIYLDPDVGLFVNRYEPDPLDGEYPGIEGDRKKKNILARSIALFGRAKEGSLHLGSLKVVDAVIYRTGKYDHIYTPTADFQFPDEGIRFYFSPDRLNYTLVRPSGTGNSLRFHVQLHAEVSEDNLIEQKAELRRQAKEIVDDLRDKLEAPRNA